MKRVLRFLSVCLLLGGFSAQLTPAYARIATNVTDDCSECFHAWYYYNWCMRDYSCRNNYMSDPEDWCRSHGANDTHMYICRDVVQRQIESIEYYCGNCDMVGECEAYSDSGNSEAFCEELVSTSCTFEGNTGTCNNGCCEVDTTPLCARGSCTNIGGLDSDCPSGFDYCEDNGRYGCCTSRPRHTGCNVGTNINTTCIADGDMSYEGTYMPSPLVNCSTAGATYTIVRYNDSWDGEMCSAVGGANIYNLVSCSACPENKTLVSYQWLMGHKSFYGMTGSMPCEDVDYTKGTSLSNVMVCVDCESGITWTDVVGTGYQKGIYKDCVQAVSRTYYRCKPNYYSAKGVDQITNIFESNVTSALDCMPCQPIDGVATQAPAGSIKRSDCCALAGTLGNDGSGGFRLDDNCCWPDE